MKRQPKKARVPTVAFWRGSPVWKAKRGVQMPYSLKMWKRRHPEEAARIEAMAEARRQAA